jgi:hypothetical protein
MARLKQDTDTEPSALERVMRLTARPGGRVFGTYAGEGCNCRYCRSQFGEGVKP